ncbi:Uncharacterized protein dnm_057730 [Desulfonema magnum]|uniref:Uncharacterized protein n=1 Tax=Desulfonema magnum TaxID=45655 RepID=A0A975BQA0_9BACT|nr:Uncharacterized protein dnm_057730 [Desulfonema magnum]
MRGDDFSFFLSFISGHVFIALFQIHKFFLIITDLGEGTTS